MVSGRRLVEVKNTVVKEKEGFGTEKEPASQPTSSVYQLAAFFFFFPPRNFFFFGVPFIESVTLITSVNFCVFN